MYKNLAIINGALLAIMIFLNGILAKLLGSYESTLLYHIIGLVFLLIAASIRRVKIIKITQITPLLMFPGLLSVLTILCNNVTIPRIGVTLAGGIALFGQLMASSIIEHFGLFGMSVNRIRKEKILGFLVIATGIIMMITL